MAHPAGGGGEGGGQGQKGRGAGPNPAGERACGGVRVEGSRQQGSWRQALVHAGCGLVRRPLARAGRLRCRRRLRTPAAGGAMRSSRSAHGLRRKLRCGQTGRKPEQASKLTLQRAGGAVGAQRVLAVGVDGAGRGKVTGVHRSRDVAHILADVQIACRGERVSYRLTSFRTGKGWIEAGCRQQEGGGVAAAAVAAAAALVPHADGGDAGASMSCNPSCSQRALCTCAAAQGCCVTSSGRAA